MTEQTSPEQPSGHKTRRHRTPDAPELTVVGAGGSPSGDAAAATSKRKGKKSAGRPFGNLFRSQPIAGTELFVREFSVNETDALTDDDASADLDDREFTVRAVHRQLNGEAVPTLDEVRAWDDEQLLAGARAMLSFPALKVVVDGVEQPPEPEEVAGIPDPLTFSTFREAITAYPKRINASIAKTAARIVDLGLPRMFNALDVSGINAVSRQAGILGSQGPGSAVRSAIASLATSPTMNIKPLELDFLKGTAAQLKSLTDMGGVVESLGKFQATTRMAERLATPIDYTAHEPIARMPALKPYHPEVDAIEALGGRIEAMAENQAKADRELLDAMTGLAERIRDQGVATQGVVAEVKGLRDDQRWPNRAVIIAAVIAGALLVVGVIAAIPVIKDLLGL